MRTTRRAFSATSTNTPGGPAPARLAPLSDVARIEGILARLSAEDRALLEPRALPRSRLRCLQLNERDAAVRALAVDHPDSTSWRVAKRIARELARYVECGPWRFDRDRGPPADDPRRAAMFRAVQLSGDKAPSRDTIWRALAGWRAQRKKT